MAAIPRWRGFDRIKSAATLDYVEGNTHLQLLKFRILVSLHCTTESRLKLMDRFVKDYEMACQVCSVTRANKKAKDGLDQIAEAVHSDARWYLAEKDPANKITLEQIIKLSKVQSFRGVYLHFQNKADWSPQHDILHCSPLFHGKPRYDCLLFNAENNLHSLTHLISLLHVTTPNKDVLDLAYVRVFKEHHS
ncbi:hypothetical protein B0H14DRAFT_2572769 [Mycena olivaceomarginata]|nr:hypothetical protein B0H14DRAFT_2572769 [Mycena olivaceomarginata]